MASLFNGLLTLRHVYISATLAGLLSLVLIPIVRKSARRQGWVSLPRADRWNGKSVALCGGIGIFLAYLAGVTWFRPHEFQIWSVLLAGACVFALGLTDDFLHIKPS